MEKLKTATGKEFDCDFAVSIPAPAQLFVCIHNAPLVDVAQVFSNPAETVQLWHGDQYFAQYTRLVAISPDGNMTQISLSRE